jgi:hypothetical protein
VPEYVKHPLVVISSLVEAAEFTVIPEAKFFTILIGIVVQFVAGA